jgi:hypothetical protein
MERPVRWLPCLALLAILSGVATGARAVPITYSAGGQIGTTSTGDALQLDNASVRLTMLADTSDAPVSTAATADGIEAHYRPSSGLLEITNRPGGAPDLAIPYTPDLVTVNRFEPSALPDRFELDEGSTTALPGTSRFFLAGFRVSFLDAAFFPGTDAGALPHFDVTGGVVMFGVFYDLDRVALYDFSSGSSSSAGFRVAGMVPEPSSALLLVLGLSGLALRSSQSRASGQRIARISPSCATDANRTPSLE